MNPTTTEQPERRVFAIGDGPSLETSEHRCPRCLGVAIGMVRGRVLMDSVGRRRIEYQCCACGTPFWLIQAVDLWTT